MYVVCPQDSYSFCQYTTNFSARNIAKLGIGPVDEASFMQIVAIKAENLVLREKSSQVYVLLFIYFFQSHLVDGSPFQPILRRQHIHDTRATPTEVKFEDSEGSRGKRRPSLVVQTQGLE